MIGAGTSYGKEKARDILIGWVVDDGQESRGNRNQVFKPDWQMMGSCHGEHKNY